MRDGAQHGGTVRGSMHHMRADFFFVDKTESFVNFQSEWTKPSSSTFEGSSQFLTWVQKIQ
jgi:hypothetical protein